MCHLQWQPPFWDRLSNRKHMKANKRSWERSLTKSWTGAPDEPAQFDPNLTEAELEEMELEIARGDGGTLIKDICHKRTFYRDMGRDIGASLGEMTSYIFVEYHNSGDVHGRPMTLKQIQEKIKRANK
jgi:hypothetical protein